MRRWRARCTTPSRRQRTPERRDASRISAHVSRSARLFSQHQHAAGRGASKLEQSSKSKKRLAFGERRWRRARCAALTTRRLVLRRVPPLVASGSTRRARWVTESTKGTDVATSCGTGRSMYETKRPKRRKGSDLKQCDAARGAKKLQGRTASPTRSSTCSPTTARSSSARCTTRTAPRRASSSSRGGTLSYHLKSINHFPGPRSVRACSRRREGRRDMKRRTSTAARSGRTRMDKQAWAW